MFRAAWAQYRGPGRGPGWVLWEVVGRELLTHPISYEGHKEPHKVIADPTMYTPVKQCDVQRGLGSIIIIVSTIIDIIIT